MEQRVKDRKEKEHIKNQDEKKTLLYFVKETLKVKRFS